MNLNATPETVQAIGQVLKMAKILDDRMGQPDKARIAAWAEQVERHKLTESDLLDGLQAYYDGPSDHPIGIGDLIHHGKSARRVRLDKQSRAEREARQAELDAVKPAPEETLAVAAAFVAGPIVERTDRLDVAEQALEECCGREASQAAIVEYFSAKAAARKGKRKGRQRVAAPPAPMDAGDTNDPTVAGQCPTGPLGGSVGATGAVEADR